MHQSDDQYQSETLYWYSFLGLCIGIEWGAVPPRRTVLRQLFAVIGQINKKSLVLHGTSRKSNLFYIEWYDHW